MSAHTPSGHFDSKESSFHNWRLIRTGGLSGVRLRCTLSATHHLIPEVGEATARWEKEEWPVDLKSNPTARLHVPGCWRVFATIGYSFVAVAVMGLFSESLIPRAR